MLVAWANGKKRTKTEYEDEIVSAIFGPLLFTTPEHSCAIFRQIAKACEIIVLPSAKTCKIEFWPNLAKSGRVEPDMVVELLDNKRSLCAVMLIEAKWNSEQSDDQLGEQYSAAKKKYSGEHFPIWHIFLTKEPKSLQEMLGTDASTNYALHLRSLTWSKVTGVLATQISPSPDLKQWAKYAQKFLSVLKQVRFEGVVTAVKQNEGWDEMCDVDDAWHFQPKLMQIESLLVDHEKWNNMCAHNKANNNWQFNEQGVSHA